MQDKNLAEEIYKIKGELAEKRYELYVVCALQYAYCKSDLERDYWNMAKIQLEYLQRVFI